MKELLKILVACHKPENVYQDEAYTPIHVGKVQRGDVRYDRG